MPPVRPINPGTIAFGGSEDLAKFEGHQRQLPRKQGDERGRTQEIAQQRRRRHEKRKPDHHPALHPCRSLRKAGQKGHGDQRVDGHDRRREAVQPVKRGHEHDLPRPVRESETADKLCCHRPSNLTLGESSLRQPLRDRYSSGWLNHRQTASEFVWTKVYIADPPSTR